MGIPFLIAALVLNLNTTSWFKGEDGVETALWWVGGVLLAIHIVLWLIAAASINSARKRSKRW